MMRINSFAELRFASNTQDQAALSFMARYEQFQADIMNRTLFFTLWWKALSDEQAGRLIQDTGDYHYWLEENRHFKPHTLSEPEEKIINIKNTTGSQAISTLYSTITNRYVFKLEVDGEQKELTRGELMSYVRGPDPNLRARAYQELYRVYGQDGAILGQMYQTLVRDWRNEQISLRSFSSPIAARNLVNDIPNEAVDALLEVSRQNAGLFQRFFKLKARLLGLEKLRRYDIYAPVVTSEKHYPYETAAQIVLDSFSRFEPRFGDLACRVFEQDHLDSEVRKGKMGGAFCLTALPDVTPWVLLNYQGKSDDVATMAHELGHAIHSMLASHHSAFTFHSSLPLAETASTFGEMMLVDRLLSEETDPAVRRDLLFRQMDGAYGTIMRQAFFALFERTAHEMTDKGASVDELSAAYLENLQEQFGDSLEIGDEFRWEWVSIPHIYNVPFYVYAYAFGQLLVFSLYQQFRKEGDAFKPRYIKVLSAGGSDAPARILSEAGIDIRSAAFWQGGFDVIRGLIDELEKSA
jgi:oligoendopeptidase F